jgi:hypothetical protein
VDRNGNPLIVSGIVVYQFVNSKRAALDIENAAMFVRDQSQAVMKQIVSEYPYEVTPPAFYNYSSIIYNT